MKIPLHTRSHLFCSVWAAITKYWMAYKQRTFISHSSGGWESHDQGPADLVWEPTSWFSLCPQIVEGARVLSGVSFHKDTNPLMQAPLSWPNHLPKASPPNTITLGIRISTHEFGGDIQSKAPLLTFTSDFYFKLFPYNLYIQRCILFYFTLA